MPASMVPGPDLTNNSKEAVMVNETASDREDFHKGFSDGFRAAINPNQQIPSYAGPFGHEYIAGYKAGMEEGHHQRNAHTINECDLEANRSPVETTSLLH